MYLEFSLFFKTFTLNSYSCLSLNSSYTWFSQGTYWHSFRYLEMKSYQTKFSLYNFCQQKNKILQKSRHWQPKHRKHNCKTNQLKASCWRCLTKYLTLHKYFILEKKFFFGIVFLCVLKLFLKRIKYFSILPFSMCVIDLCYLWRGKKNLNTGKNKFLLKFW